MPFFGQEPQISSFSLCTWFALQFEDRWYFWLIIGLVAAFSIVVAFFVGRGVWKWRKNKKRWEGASHNDSLVHEEEETTIGNGASNSLADGISRGSVDADKSEEQKRNDETLSNEVRAMSKLGTASCDVEKGNRHDDVVVPVDMEDLRRRVGHRGHHRCVYEDQVVWRGSCHSLYIKLQFVVKLHVEESLSSPEFCFVWRLACTV